MVAWTASLLARRVVTPRCRSTSFPTLAELAGLPPRTERPFDGVSLAGRLLRGEDLAARALFWEHGGAAAVRRGPWKLLVRRERGKRTTELFQLDRDLSERDNVAGDRPELTRELSSLLGAWKRSVTTGATPQPAKS